MFLPRSLRYLALSSCTFLLCGGTTLSAEISDQEESVRSFEMAEAPSSENVGFFYEVYDASFTDQPLGYILGVVHPVPRQHSDMLNLNMQMRDAFENSTVFLPEINFCALSDQIIGYISRLAESRALAEDASTQEKRRLSDQRFQREMSRASFDVILLKMVEAKILAGESCQILNLESLETHLLAIADGFFDIPMSPDEVADFFNGCAEAWKRGDTSFLEEVPSAVSIGELYQHIHNQNLFQMRKLLMAESIDFVIRNKLERGETFFAFPGAALLYGEKNIIDNLEDMGYIVVRR